MCCAINNSGTAGASGGLNNIVSVYSMPEDGPAYLDASEDGNEVALTGHDSAIQHVRFVPSGSVADNGAVLASSSGDSTIKIWDVQSKSSTATLAGHTVRISYCHDLLLLRALARCVHVVSFFFFRGCIYFLIFFPSFFLNSLVLTAATVTF